MNPCCTGEQCAFIMTVSMAGQRSSRYFWAILCLYWLLTVETWSPSPVLEYDTVNCCALSWHLINLPSHGSVNQTGLPASYLMFLWYPRQLFWLIVLLAPVRPIFSDVTALSDHKSAMFLLPVGIVAKTMKIDNQNFQVHVSLPI